jgi:hypothetical protein
LPSAALGSRDSIEQQRTGSTHVTLKEIEPWIPWVLGILLFGGSITLGAFTNLLKDSSTAARRPYSFARVQLLWWVLVITFCILEYYATHNGALPALNQTCLLLLGIGVGTTGIANVIDRRQRASADAQGREVSQDFESQTFLIDILSDDGGLSVHRLQALIFNVIYGVAFITTFISDKDNNFPKYDEMQLAVLGLSTAGYLGLKALENNPSAGTGTTPGGDELPDVDPSAPAKPLASG